MTRCKEYCVNGLRCKKNVLSSEYCSIHDPNIICIICNDSINFYDRFTISECGHKFHKNCLTDSVMKNQWYNGFSTEDKLHCPECKTDLGDTTWQNLTCVLVDVGLLKRKKVYKIYLCPEIYVKLLPVLKLNQEYNNNQYENIKRYGYNIIGGQQWCTYNHNKRMYTDLSDNDVDKVIFVRYPQEQGSIYIFCLGDPIIKNLFEHVEKELIEHVFHPDRVKLEDLD